MIVHGELVVLTIEQGHAEEGFFPLGLWSMWSTRQDEVIFADHG